MQDTSIRAYIRAQAAQSGASMNLTNARLANQIGVSFDTLRRWQRQGVPESGNKRNVAAIEALQRIMEIK